MLTYMDLLHRIQRYLRNPEDFLNASLKRITMLYLTARNHYCPVALVCAGGPVVSLTTHGSRIESVHLAIETIGRGTVRPSRLILWLDDEAAYRNLSPELQRLARRGLEIRLCKNYGPHTKYYPYVQSESQFTLPLVTADDDILYPRNWLKKLNQAFQKSSKTINCNFARHVRLNPEGIGHFLDWRVCETTKPSFCHHALGVFGVIYPPAFLAELKRVGPGFLDCCPKADDIWLHVQAIRAGYRIQQMEPQAIRFFDIPGTGGIALWNENGSGGNDAQAEKTYTPADIEVLRQ